MLSKTIELCNLRITNAILGIAHVIDDNIMTGMTQQYISDPKTTPVCLDPERNLISVFFRLTLD